MEKLEHLRPQTKANREAEKFLTKRGIEKGCTLMAAKKPPGTKGTTATKVTTNLFGLDLGKPVTVFRYEVRINGHIIGLNNKSLTVDLTEQVKHDFLKVDRRYLCCDIFKAYKRRHETKLKSEGNLLYYDLSRTLFALKDLEIDRDGKPEQFTIDQLVDRNDSLKHFPVYSVEVLPVTSKAEKMTVGDFAFLTNDVAQMDQSLAQFLDIATAQNVFADPSQFMHYNSSSIYLMMPSAFNFTEKDSPVFDSNSSFLGIGMNKSVRFIEDGQKDNGAGAKAALVVQVQKTPFHNVETVLDKFKRVLPQWNNGTLENGQLAHANRMMRGLYVQTVYTLKDKPQSWQRFRIDAFSSTNALTEQIMPTNKNELISIERYYLDTHKRKLIAPSAPLVIRRDRDRISHYPMELLQICDYQRVGPNQLTPEVHQHMIRNCAIPPLNLREQTLMLKNALLLSESDHLSGLSIGVDERPIEVEARTLITGGIQYGDRGVRPDDKFRWRGSRYVLPATINCWCAIALADNSRDNNINSAGWNDFVRRYYTMMKNKGMNVQEPFIKEMFSLDKFDLRDWFLRMQEEGVEFVLVAHPKGHLGDSVHHQMKYIELDTEIISQSVLIPTINRLKYNGNETLENIVNKTNIKMGGLNYALPLNTNGMLTNTLVIGFAINHPAGGFGMDLEPNRGNGSNGSSDTGSDAASDNGNGVNGQKGQKKAQFEKRIPSVVGYAANIGERHNFEFVGDYKYQEARRDEKLGIVEQIVRRCLEMYRQREKKFPSSVVIYRNACGEGFYQHLLTYEVPMLKHLLAELCEANLTMIVVNKLQNIRFTPSFINRNAKATDQNVKPGTVIDKGVVSTQWSEFFLASQRALQGTARVPRYAILVDDNNYEMDQIQEFTFGLCFGHQIVNSPISLPAPVYIALEYAKRGRNNFNTDQNSAESRMEASADFNALTENLGLERKIYLSKWRVNA